MSGWETSSGWGNPGDARNALKDVTNTPTSHDEGGWGKASAYDDTGRSSKDYGGSRDYDNENGGKPAGGYFRCGSEDHMKNECPGPPKLAGECFNCGEIGHNKADCTNERVVRPFTGTCNVCQEDGDRASDCPSAPTKLCRNCEEPEGEGHTAATCKNRRKIQRDSVKDGQAEQAWNDLVAAAMEGDMDDVRDAMKLYTDALPEVTYTELEEAFRAMNIPVYLVAIEKSVINSFTVIDLQGNIDKTYVVWIRKSPKPSRPYEAEMWPATPQENFERLKDAGVVESRRAVRCSGCGELGHTRKYCQDAASVVTQGSVIHCYNCGEDGHRYRECPKPREDKNACRNCKQSGHESGECPESRSLDNVNCNTCNEMGHFSRDCPTTGGSGSGGGGPKGCFNCDSEDHQSRECPLPRDYSRVKRKTCGDMGHIAVRCKSGDDYRGGNNSESHVMSPDDGGWGAPVAHPEGDSARASGWAKVPKGSDIREGFVASGDGGWGWGASATSLSATPARPTVSLYNSSSTGSAQGSTPPSAGQASTAPRSASTTLHDSGRQKSPYDASESPWNDARIPASAGSSAPRPQDEADEVWDSWGICARDGKVDRFTASERTPQSTGGARITSNTQRTPGLTLRPLFLDDGKNRHQQLSSNLSPTIDMTATGRTRFPVLQNITPFSASRDEMEDDIPRAGGFGGGSSSPVHTVANNSANTTPAETRSSVPAYAYQPARGPIGGASRALRPAAAAFQTIHTSSADKTPAATVSPKPPTPQAKAFVPPDTVAASTNSPAIRSAPSPLASGPRARRASSVAKPFLPPHMATPTRIALDLPFRDMEHLERTPPPKGAEVFFDSNIQESAVVDDESASTTPTTPGLPLPPPPPPVTSGW